MDWQVDLGAPGEIFDIAITSVFRATLDNSQSSTQIMKDQMRHTGIVRAPSLATFSLISSEALPAWVFVGFGGCATIRSSIVFAEISSPSRRFHSARTSAEGAHPKIPGWIKPAKRTCGMWREEQKIPSKSQIAFALQQIV